MSFFCIHKYMCLSRLILKTFIFNIIIIIIITPSAFDGFLAHFTLFYRISFLITFIACEISTGRGYTHSMQTQMSTQLKPVYNY